MDEEGNEDDVNDEGLAGEDDEDYETDEQGDEDEDEDD